MYDNSPVGQLRLPLLRLGNTYMRLRARSLTGLFATALTFGLNTFAPTPLQAAEAESVPGEYIVKFRWRASDAQFRRALGEGRMRIKRHVQTRPMSNVGEDGLTLVASELPPQALADRLRNDPAVESIEPNFIYRTAAVSNDPSVVSGSTWGLLGSASTPANTYGSAAVQAWANGYTGSSSVIVAVIDDGIQTTHPDLYLNIWVNSHEAVDGIDNDGNGYIDDVSGWNFAADSGQLYVPADKHGTHVAGTIGARGGNAVGVAGVNWQVGLIAARFLAGGSGTTIDAVEAIDYIIDLKSRHSLNIVAINASWGGGGYSSSLHAAVNRAAKAGILFIAAAGNNGTNNDLIPYYPANFDTRVAAFSESAASYDAVVAVAALNSSGSKAGFSNYGLQSVDLGAPGATIYSTIPNNAYAYMSGTSMAAPHVTGGVALYASTHPMATPEEIRNALLGAVTPTVSMSGKTVTGGRLNLASVIEPPDPVDPPDVETPTDLAASAQKSTIAGLCLVSVQWDAVPGDNITYTLRRGPSASGPWEIAASGLSVTSFGESLPAGITYFYTVSAVADPDESAPAAPVSVTPAAPAPSNLVAVPAINGTSAKLTWADNTSDEQGFKLEMDIGDGWRPPSNLKSNATSVNISWISGVSVYKFRLRAYLGNTFTEYSNEATVVRP